MTSAKRSAKPTVKPSKEEASSSPSPKRTKATASASPGSKKADAKKQTPTPKERTLSLPKFLADDLDKFGKEFKASPQFAILMMNSMSKDEVSVNFKIDLMYCDYHLLGYMAILNQKTKEEYIRSLIEKDIRENFKNAFFGDLKAKKEAKA